MPDDDIPLSDRISTEIDRRKVQKLVDDGIILPEDLRNAPLVQIVSPENPRILSVTCQTDGCGRVLKDMSEFEEHLALDHMGLRKADDDE